MASLLLRLAAPMQAWGDESKFDERRTLSYPTKSGIIGLLAAALGRSREQSLEDLQALKIAVRIDKPGVIIKDYQITKAVAKPAKNKKSFSFSSFYELSDKDMESTLSDRYYLSDAVFVAAIESDDKELLQHLEQAVKSPVYTLFLGRKSCPPTMPLCLGIREGSCLESLKMEESHLRKGEKVPEKMRIIYEDNVGGTAVIKDSPISFDSCNRSYGYRKVSQTYLEMIDISTAETTHDPFGELD